MLHFINGFRLRMIQRLELLVAKIELDIVQIFSDRFLQKQPGGIQHSNKDDLHQQNSLEQMTRTSEVEGLCKPLQKRIGDDCESDSDRFRSATAFCSGEHTAKTDAKSKNGIFIISIN